MDIIGYANGAVRGIEEGTRTVKKICGEHKVAHKIVSDSVFLKGSLQSKFRNTALTGAELYTTDFDGFHRAYLFRMDKGKGTLMSLNVEADK